MLFVRQLKKLKNKPKIIKKKTKKGWKWITSASSDWDWIHNYFEKSIWNASVFTSPFLGIDIAVRKQYEELRSTFRLQSHTQLHKWNFIYFWQFLINLHLTKFVKNQCRTFQMDDKVNVCNNVFVRKLANPEKILWICPETDQKKTAQSYYVKWFIT